MRFSTALLLVALTGFNALSLEICWSRLYYYLSATKAWSFAGMLCAYLLGLALGSLWSIRFQQLHEAQTPALQSAGVARLVLFANIAGFLLTPLVSWAAVILPWVATYPLLIVTAALLGTLLPLICHFSVPPDARVGARLSRLYLANIAGSGVGSLLTGFLLMEYLPLRWIAVLLLGISVCLYIMLHPAGPVRSRALVTGGSVLVAGILLTPALYWQFWERLQYKSDWGPDKAFKEIVESRSGVITVDHENYIYGGGAYDGIIEVSPAKNDWLVRAYALPALHPDPQDVLMVGMSGGSWAQIVAADPQVKHLTVVEISHSYTQLIARHPVVASLLTNPKVTIVIDDGRRWMEYHKDRKFDAILMNTTHHWREFASNLLSTDFLQMARHRLKPGGVFQYNATDSLRVARSALDVFPHVMLLLNNIVVSESPLEFNTARWKPLLTNWTIDGKPVFDPANPGDQKVLAKMLRLESTLGQEPAALEALYPGESDAGRYRLWNHTQLETATAGADPITDDNLGHEYRWW